MCVRFLPTGTYEGSILRIVVLDERGEVLLGAQDGAAEVGLLDGFVLDGEAEGGVGVWDAVEDYYVWVRGVWEGGERVGCYFARD